jgi:hypothetical protein
MVQPGNFFSYPKDMCNAQIIRAMAYLSSGENPFKRFGGIKKA